MKRVCLVASDILGVITNSGIATATTHLALVLANRGYEVTVVNTGHAQTLDATWEKRYDHAGVAVEHVDRSVPVSPDYLQESYLIYRHLAGGEFDSIVFQDWLGPAFSSVRAKQAGSAFASTQLVIVTHGPTEWVREANRELKFTHTGLATAHMEQVALEGADLVVGPSAYLHNWMSARGWGLGRRVAPIPYFTAGHVADLTGLDEFRRARKAPESADPLDELVFFGRLEHRKGVRLYLEALNLVDPERLVGVTLSFLGREATYTRADIRALLRPDVIDAVRALEFHATLDQEEARTYLHQPGRVAVIPSLDDNSPNTVYECLEDRVPFIAADTGGIGELVDPRDRPACLFPAVPAALAEFLDRLLASRDRLPVARPAFDAATSLGAWEAILASDPSSPVEVVEQPLVSVVIPHHDRPDLVALTLDSIANQDYPNLEVVLVDDGSRTAAAHEALLRFEGQSWPFALIVVRQENAFLGAARNTGVRNARGNLLIFIDDDDLADPDYVSTMVRAIELTGAAAVSCAFKMFAEQEGPPAETTGTWVFLGGSLPLMVTGNHAGGAGIILRRSAWEAVGGYHELHGLGLEDWDLLTRIIMQGLPVVAIPEPLYSYRLRPDSMRLTMDRFQSYQIILDRFREMLPDGVRVFADLVHGQALAWAHRSETAGLEDELDRRERYQWLLERRIELLEQPEPLGVDG